MSANLLRILESLYKQLTSKRPRPKPYTHWDQLETFYTRGKQPKPKGTEQNPYPYLSVCKKLQDDEATPDARILEASWPPSSPASSCSTMEERELRARFPPPAMAGIGIPICAKGLDEPEGQVEEGDARRHRTVTAR